MSIMSNLGEALIEESEARGLEKGILNSLKNLMANMNLTVQEAMNALGIPEEEQPLWQEKLSAEHQSG